MKFIKSCLIFLFSSSNEKQIKPTKPSPIQDIISPLRVTKDKQTKFEKQVVRMLCSSLLPFTLVEDPEFIKVINMANPGLKLPKRKMVATEMLDDVYLEEKERLKKLVSGKRATLEIDG